MDDRTVRERVARADALLAEIESMPDPTSRSLAVEAIQALLALYSEGLTRIVATVIQRDEDLLRAFAGDELISHLLLLHGLHPEDVETRVRRALREVEPYLASNGREVELVSVAGGVVRLRLSKNGSRSDVTAAALRHAVEQAVQAAAPDVFQIEIEGAGMPSPTPGANFVPLTSLSGNSGGNDDA